VKTFEHRSTEHPSSYRAMRTKTSRLTSAVLLLIGLSSGCGRSNENLASVTGTITLDGQPLADAQVVFTPIFAGTTSYGRTDDDGTYEMVFSDHEDGAWLGRNKVQVSTGDVDGEGGPGKPERVPVVYNRKTTLTADVGDGENVFDFRLDSKAGVIAPVTSD
jgi:hypothetical protein